MQIKSVLLFCGILTLSSAMVGCKKEKISGSGTVITETRSIRNFHNVQLEGNSKLFISGGTDFRVEVKGYENIVPKLKTLAEDGTLKISFDKNTTISNDNSEIHISMPSLVNVIGQGNGDISINGPFIGMENFSIKKEGLGKIEVQNTIAKNFNLNLIGNIQFAGFGLTSENAIVKITGNGDAELTVTKKLNVTLTGNGTVYYQGSPEVVPSISGNGKIVKK